MPGAAAEGGRDPRLGRKIWKMAMDQTKGRHAAAATDSISVAKIQKLIVRLFVCPRGFRLSKAGFQDLLYPIRTMCPRTTCPFLCASAW